MIFSNPTKNYVYSRQQIVDHYTLDENNYVDTLMSTLINNTTTEHAIHELATSLVEEVRARHSEQKGILAFIRQYNLSTEEGVVLMCLAEALLRIPDLATANKLIKDKLSDCNWEQHLGESQSLFVNASTWGLMLSGKIIRFESQFTNSIGHYINALISKSSDAIIRAALKEAMHIMGKQFVISNNIKDAVKNQALYSFDMLGEAAITTGTAQYYFESYLQAIKTIGLNKTDNKPNNISIKLSALHCRYEFAQQQILITELYPKLHILLETAIEYNTAITIDAEESNRLDIMLDAFSFMYNIAVKHKWPQLGIVVQAYQYRSLFILKWLNEITTDNNCQISVRLVKGAYWDTEIKIAQQQGFAYYPVFTRKENTDLCYLCCVQYLFQCVAIYPQFASHNAHTIASIIQFSRSNKEKPYEFQRLFGMGELLYDSLYKKHAINCRIYAPVGNYKSLLPYLVRRLLENGANNSFVQQIENPNINLSSITRSPLERVKKNSPHHNTLIPLPKNIFYSERENASGINLTNINEVTKLDLAFTEFQNNNDMPTLELASVNDINASMSRAKSAYQSWSKSSVSVRVECLMNLAALMETHKYQLITLIVTEAGRCISDAISEVREAIDFCRYYAQQARLLFKTESLTSPTGETNVLSLHARGIYTCISPWNFPIAIFTGQITAALVTGNCVLAKPAQQTSICALKIVELCHQAGIPTSVLQLIHSSSLVVSDSLLRHADLSGVVFTGSLATANKIKQTLASRSGAIIPFIAETSGMNAMIADSSALPEQLVLDVLSSAFNSAGQRCSSLRFLYLQDDIADDIIELLKDAVSELKVSDPTLLATDIGPLIDKASKNKISEHLKFLSQSDFATKIVDINLDSPQLNSTELFIHPAIYEIKHLSQITNEVFGPVLHVIRYQQQNLITVVDEINNSGFGLTLGIHSRINSTINTVTKHAKIGNIYVNRNIIGAVVGVQPFGGLACSGTGPKAGGPHYLNSFCTEQVISTNTSAIGGNQNLLNMTDE